MVNRLAHAKACKGYASTREALLLNGRFVLEQVGRGWNGGRQGGVARSSVWAFADVLATATVAPAFGKQAMLEQQQPQQAADFMRLLSSVHFNSNDSIKA